MKGFLSFHSHHLVAHKRAVVKSLTDRAKIIPSSSDQRSKEMKHLTAALVANGHMVSWEASKILCTSANWHNRCILEAWDINTCRNPLNHDDGMHSPHEFLNLALRDRT